MCTSHIALVKNFIDLFLQLYIYEYYKTTSAVYSFQFNFGLCHSLVLPTFCTRWESVNCQSTTVFTAITISVSEKSEKS